MNYPKEKQLNQDLFESALDKLKIGLKQAVSNNDLLVFYGFARLTPKIIKKRSIVIFFENSKLWTYKKEKYINQKMHIVHIRKQTKEEAEDATSINREWTRYEIFVDDKPFNGNLELALERNFLKDSNNVSLYEREIIREKLRKEYHSFYKLNSKLTGQQAIIFD
jgi:hypothetical protein